MLVLEGPSFFVSRRLAGESRHEEWPAMDATSFRIDSPSLSKPHISIPLPSVSLEIQRGKARELTRQVKTPVFLIGSALDGDLVLSDANFPEAYAYLMVNGTGVFLQYLGDGPELTVNGMKGETFRLEDGERIEAGPFAFIVRIEPGRPKRKDDLPEEEPAWLESDADEDQSSDWFGLDAAVDEVRALLNCVRSQFGMSPSALKLFVGPETTEIESSPERHVA